MGFNDFSEYGRKHHSHDHDHYGRDDNFFDHDDDHHNSHYHSRHHDFKRELISKYLRDPKLRRLVIFAMVAILAIAIVIIILLFPLLVKLFDFITANGIQGLIDSVWKGNK